MKVDNSTISDYNSNMSKATAICTFGDGPDILVGLRSDQSYDLVINDDGDATFGLSEESALKLIDHLQGSVKLVRDYKTQLELQELKDKLKDLEEK